MFQFEEVPVGGICCVGNLAGIVTLCVVSETESKQ
jgi:hypothetical protein